MRVLCTFMLLASVPGCADYFHDDEPEPRQCLPAPADVDPSGVAYQFVVDTIDLPRSADETFALGFDLDCDERERVDNAIGQILSMIASFDNGGYDLDAESKQLIDAGELLHLLQLQATSLQDADGVGVVVLHGTDTDGDVSDNFSGSEPFAIDESRGRGFLSGRIDDGTLTGAYGTAPIAIAFPGLDEPYVLPLIGARIAVDIDADGINGRIGGAVPEELIDSELLPVFQEGLSRVVARDCENGVCEDGSFGESLLGWFDDDMDGAITLVELRESELVGWLLTPDVDLRDQDGNFAPGRDGVKDALSVGMGFTGVGASFTRP